MSTADGHGATDAGTEVEGDGHHGDAGHGADHAEPLGPVDVRAWALALLGVGVGLLVVVALWVATSA